MSFTPVIPVAGYSGWRFLGRTMDSQSAAHRASPSVARDIEYFREKIVKVTSGQDLVKDHRLLKVALTAFGLQDDLPNKAFIRRILDDGTTDDTALANRLADKRYLKFSEAFGLGGPLPPKTRLPGFADKILARFEETSFELAVGAVNGDMRLAMNAARELPKIVADGGRENTLWLRVMGNPPLRQVFEAALGLPSSVGALDLDQQLKIFQERSQAMLGTDKLSELGKKDRTEDVVRLFLTRMQLNQGPGFQTPGFAAVTLLQNAL